MKKLFVIGLMISLSLSLCACTQSDKKNLDTNIEGSNLVDKTVTDENIVNIDGINEENIIESKVEQCEYAISLELSNIINNSEEIINGTVKKVSYVVYEGMEWTKIDIVVNESLSGSLAVNEYISVYRLGGYISLEEHNKSFNDEEKFNLSKSEIKGKFLKSIIENEKFPTVGDNGIFFLAKTPTESPLPSGAYERVCGKNGELKLNKNNNMYERDNTIENNKDREKYTLENIKEKIKINFKI